MQMHARNKRINGFGNAVFDIYGDTRHGMPTEDRHFIATVECREGHAGGLKVLIGSMQPIGKERAWDAIRQLDSAA
jgi:hypothetical protein